MTFGLTDEGFALKRLEDILSEQSAGLKAVLGDNLDLSPSTVDGQIHGIYAASQADLWEIAQQVYNMYNPSNSTGDSLSNLVQLNGITRKPATASTVTLTLTGTGTTLIPQGSLVSTDDGSQFSTDEDEALVAGTGSVGATSVLTGSIPGGIGTIINIDTPINGWSAVTNPVAAEQGQDEETDTNLRARRIRSVSKPGNAIVDGIIAEILDLTSVIDARALENRTGTVDANGVDPHSIKILVDGGDNDEIAETIFTNTSAVTGYTGAVSVVVEDTQGISHTIKFDRPTLVPIYVTVTVVYGPGYLGDDAVKQSIVDYADGNLKPGRGFLLSEDVAYSELFIPLNQLSLGVTETTSLLIGIAPTPTGTSSLPIAAEEKASFDTANIIVIPG